MTEGEWLSCADPEEMLSFLQKSGKASDRKLRLFACACGRRAWQLLVIDISRSAIEVAERSADGAVSDAELEAVCSAAFDAPTRMSLARESGRDRNPGDPFVREAQQRLNAAWVVTHAAFRDKATSTPSGFTSLPTHWRRPAEMLPWGSPADLPATENATSPTGREGSTPSTGYNGP